MTDFILIDIVNVKSTTLKNKNYILILLILAVANICSGKVKNPHNSIDSLDRLLDTKLSQFNRLDILHQASSILYKNDTNYELLYDYAKEGIELAQKLKDVDKGADLAVWILRANIYLRSYHRNPQYYKYLKELYQEGKIEKKKIIQPLYSEIYSYLEYGKLREAEQKMIEYEDLTDKSDPQQLSYYLDTYAVFKRKAGDYKDASEALKTFAEAAEKIEDKRFLVTALSRNAEFYLVDSLNYEDSRLYAAKALKVVKDANLHQHKQHILLQLAQAIYKLNDISEFNEIYSQISKDSFAVANKIIHKDYYTFSGDIQYDQGNYEKACKDYRKAVQYLETSDFSTMELLTEKIEKCYVKLNDFRSAFVYSTRLNVLKDSLYNVQNVKAVRYFESKLEFKDAQTEKIKLENKIYAQKRSTIFIGFFSSLILLSLLFYNRLLDEKVKLRTVALNVKNQELEESLEELSQFNYIASHDIKEPMRVVSSVTGLIEKKLLKEDNDKYSKEFGMVKNSINQLYNLIEDLSQFLDFKANAIAHESIDTNKLANQVKLMLGEVTQDVNGRVEIEPLPEIISSNSLLTVIMKNLIENGLKYNVSQTPTVRVGYVENPNRHIFTFEDNGIGIDKKYHEYIFQMFKRLESREKKGSGLGLGLVSKAVEKLGGEISISSAPKVGSTFTISLPKTYMNQS